MIVFSLFFFSRHIVSFCHAFCLSIELICHGNANSMFFFSRFRKNNDFLLWNQRHEKNNTCTCIHEHTWPFIVYTKYRLIIRDICVYNIVNFPIDGIFYRKCQYLFVCNFMWNDETDFELKRICVSHWAHEISETEFVLSNKYMSTMWNFFT